MKRLVKRLVKWNLDGSVLKLAKALEDPKAVAIIEAEFDLVKLFPDYDTLNDVQKHLIVYGVKQNLMDQGASEVGDSKGKIANAKAKWEELLAGKISSPRINATGAAENKRIAGEVKEQAKVISLQGLMMKKIAFPTTFTAEDEERLQEFLEVMAVKRSKK